MAFIPTTTVRDGERIVVLHSSALCDIGGNIDKEKIVDASELSAKGFTIYGIQYNVSGGIVRLSRDTVDFKTIIDLAGDGFFDYEAVGGLPVEEDSTDTGNLLLSTLGFDIGSSYSINLTLKKNKPKINK
jgi:hypothetical protein